MRTSVREENAEPIRTALRASIILFAMKVLPLVAVALLLAGCSQELPTSPIQSAQSAHAVVPEATRVGRGRAVVPPAACADLSGIYDVVYEGHCPAAGYLKSWELQQNGCAIVVNINPDLPSVRGTVKGSAIDLSMRNGFTACAYTLDGTGTVSNGVIRATLTGPTSGPCCGSGIDTVSLVATKR